MKSSFPHEPESKLHLFEKEFYHQFCDNIVETIKLLHISDHEIDSRLHVKGGNLVEEIAKQQRPIVLYLGHYGNWEWVPAISHHYSMPIISSQIYKPLRDKAFDKFMLKIRSRFNALSIPQKKAFRTLLEMRRDYGTFLVGFISDQRSNNRNTHHTIEFLHHTTSLNVGGEEIGKRINAVYLYLDIVKLRRGYYQLAFQKIDPISDNKEYPYTRKYMQMLETTIRNNPSYWLWSHRRWLYSKDTNNKKTI